MSSLKKQRLRKNAKRGAIARIKRHKRDESVIRAYVGLDGRSVKVGLPKDSGTYPGEPGGPPPPSVVQVGVWNEFGTSTIPARSFLRSGIRKGHKRLKKVMAFSAAQVVAGNMTPERAIGILGSTAVDLIRARIKSVSSPPNAPSTIRAKLNKKKKGSLNRPLQDTGLLGQSITYRTFRKRA